MDTKVTEKSCNLKLVRLPPSFRMAVVPWANPSSAIRAYLLPNATPSSRIFPADRKRPLFLNFRIRSNILKVCCSNLKEDEVEAPFKEDTQNSERDQWEIFKAWDVPWDWKVTTYIMMPYLMSIFLTGLVEFERSQGLLDPYLPNMLAQLNNIDELAVKIFMDQLLKSVAKLLVLNIFVSPHQPLPDDVFSLDWTSPFNFKNGWILWAVGLSVASFVAFVIKAFISGLHAGYADNETEPLVRLLPVIGSSNISTVCLLCIVGILAPICEEVLYRGFLLASLTKWFPVTFSVVASSTIFTLAHHSSGKSLEIFIFGSVLGLIYAQTRNLLVPITMHALWNCGVILLLTYLHKKCKHIYGFYPTC